MAFITGKNQRFKAGATNIPCKRWRLSIRGQAVETTSGESGGYETFIGGVAGADITALLSFDDALAYTNAILPNTSYAVELYPALGTTGNKFAGTVFVETTDVISELKDQTTIELRGKANGVYTVAGL
jgi:hypothetical protein